MWVWHKEISHRTIFHTISTDIHLKYTVQLIVLLRSGNFSPVISHCFCLTFIHIIRVLSSLHDLKIQNKRLNGFTPPCCISGLIELNFFTKFLIYVEERDQFRSIAHYMNNFETWLLFITKSFFDQDAQ